MTEYKITVNIHIVKNPLNLDELFTISNQRIENIIRTNQHEQIEDKLFDISEQVLTNVRDDVRSYFFNMEENDAS